MSKKVMKLIDPSTGKMQCKVCGVVTLASLQSGYKRADGVTRYYRGSWQCPHGCKLPEKKNEETPARVAGINLKYDKNRVLLSGNLTQALYNQMQKLLNNEITTHEAEIFAKQAGRLIKLQKKIDALIGEPLDDERRSIEEEIKTLSESLRL